MAVTLARAGRSARSAHYEPEPFSQRLLARVLLAGAGLQDQQIAAKLKITPEKAATAAHPVSIVCPAGKLEFLSGSL